MRLDKTVACHRKIHSGGINNGANLEDISDFKLTGNFSVHFIENCTETVQNLEQNAMKTKQCKIIMLSQLTCHHMSS
jgi:hypothetical protein